MMISDLTHNPRGSMWHRWDPRLHTPGTLQSYQIQGDWESYLQRIEAASPLIPALGVTDYWIFESR